MTFAFATRTLTVAALLLILCGATCSTLAQRPTTTPTTAADTFDTPLAVRDIKLTLSPAVAEAGAGNKRFVTTLAVDLSNVEARSKDGDGQAFSVEVFVRIVGPDGHLLKENGETINFKVKAADLQRVLCEGLVSQLEVDATKAGFYRISIGARDTVSGRIGSVTRFFEVPVGQL